jgi:hypothetical protein
MGKLFTLPSEVARLIASQRRPKVRVCAVCGAEFSTVGRGLYCSPRCSARAYRARHPEKTRRPEGYWREYYRKNREKILARRRTTGAGESAPTGR